jgi:hypothetical protein
MFASVWRKQRLTAAIKVEKEIVDVEFFGEREI